MKHSYENEVEGYLYRVCYKGEPMRVALYHPARLHSIIQQIWIKPPKKYITLCNNIILLVETVHYKKRRIGEL